MIQKLFLSHPKSVGESFGEHFGVASRFGATMVVSGVACMIHAFVPALFERTGSKAVKRLYADMASRQPNAPRPAFQQPEWQLEYEI